MIDLADEDEEDQDLAQLCYCVYDPHRIIAQAKILINEVTSPRLIIGFVTILVALHTDVKLDVHVSNQDQVDAHTQEKQILK